MLTGCILLCSVILRQIENKNIYLLILHTTGMHFDMVIKNVIKITLFKLSNKMKQKQYNSIHSQSQK